MQRSACAAATGGLLFGQVRGYSESLLSELDPLELVLPDSDELLLLSREGPPEGAEPALSEGDGQERGTQPHAPPTRTLSDACVCSAFLVPAPASHHCITRQDPPAS